MTARLRGRYATTRSWTPSGASPRPFSSSPTDDGKQAAASPGSSGSYGNRHTWTYRSPSVTTSPPGGRTPDTEAANVSSRSPSAHDARTTYEAVVRSPGRWSTSRRVQPSSDAPAGVRAASRMSGTDGPVSSARPGSVDGPGTTASLTADDEPDMNRR